MKIGIISDIHGNVKALEVVLKELENENVDKLICLGDLIGGAPRSEEVVQRIMSIQDKLLIVRGNREGYIINGMPKIVHDEKIVISEEQLKRNEWLKRQLSCASKDFIYSLPKEIICNFEGKKIYISHYPMKEDGSFKRHIKEATAEENEKMFSEIEADIFLYGHTHKEIYNNRNGKNYINPGALGCPEKTELAPYGILYIEKGKAEYRQLYAKYDVKEVIQDIKEAKFPGYEKVLSLFFGVE